MVQITNIEATHDYVVVEYNSNGILISARVMEDKERTPQEIVEKGYAELRPHIQMECDRLGIEADHELPQVEDKVLSISLVGVSDVQFTEGQTPIEKSYRCTGKTLYGKTVDLTDVAIFSPDKEMVLEPTKNDVLIVGVSYEDLLDSKSFSIFYKSQAEVEAEALAKAEYEAELSVLEAERLANIPPTTDEKVDSLIETLVDKGVLL
jgi:hypothetical protein